MSLCHVRTKYTRKGTPPQLTTTMSRTESGRFGHARCPFRARKVPEHGLAADSSDGVVLLPSLVESLVEHDCKCLPPDAAPVALVVLRR